jgi:peptide/nickel transport system ATP-binding protein
MALLEVENLGVTIDTARGPLRAVESVSFTVERGKTLCLVGESGCGKSLTALALMGLLPRRATRMAPRLQFDGKDIGASSYSELRRIRGHRISMIFQEPMTSLNPVFTIGRQLIDVHRAHLGSSEKTARERAMFLLDRVGIPAAHERLAQFPHQLSGGLRQRVMVAMALMCGPDLLIADEPTTALDVTIQAELLRLLIELQREMGMGMIFITHDLGIVSRIADHAAVMYAGQIVEMGRAADVVANPQHPYTQGLMACLPGAIGRGKRLFVIPGQVPSLLGELKGCRFRERCPHSVDSCQQEIELRRTHGDHLSRCILAMTGQVEATVSTGAG